MWLGSGCENTGLPNRNHLEAFGNVVSIETAVNISAGRKVEMGSSWWQVVLL